MKFLMHIIIMYHTAFTVCVLKTDRLIYSYFSNRHLLNPLLLSILKGLCEDPTDVETCSTVGVIVRLLQIHLSILLY